MMVIQKPLKYLVASLNNSCDVINVFGLLFTSTLQALQRLDLLVKLALQDCQLTCQLQRIDVEQLELLAGLWSNRWRRWS